MRDVNWYISQNRNNPNSPQQKKEHPYNFVRLSDSIQRQSIISNGHHVHNVERLEGNFEYQITLESPLHIGSGIYAFAKDCGFSQDGVVQGIARFQGQPIIPGTSLKGSIRSIYEAITKSCVRCHKNSYTIPWSKDRSRSKLPQELIPPQTKQYGTIKVTPVFHHKPHQCRNINDSSQYLLCPACSLFGAMGWLGRVSFFDANLIHEAKEKIPLSVPSLQSPQAHRIGRKCNITNHQGTIDELEGRKFYYQSSLKTGNCPWDYIGTGSCFLGKVQFHNLEPAELGTLFLAMGIYEENHPILLGGGKTIGFGRTKFLPNALQFFSNMTTWEQSSTSYTNETLSKKIEECKKLYQDSWPSAYTQGLKEYREIINTKQ